MRREQADNGEAENAKIVVDRTNPSPEASLQTELVADEVESLQRADHEATATETRVIC